MWVSMNQNLDAREKHRAVLDVRRGPFPPWGENGKQVDNRDKSIELGLMSQGRPMLALRWSPGCSVRAGVAGPGGSSQQPSTQASTLFKFIQLCH